RWPWLPEQAQLRRIPVRSCRNTGTADEMARPPGGNAEILQGFPDNVLEASGADGVVRPRVPVRLPAAAGRAGGIVLGRIGEDGELVDNGSHGSPFTVCIYSIPVWLVRSRGAARAAESGSAD